ncbi:hypothetical protein FQZ97_725310 [compost metagenome]
MLDAGDLVVVVGGVHVGTLGQVVVVGDGEGVALEVAQRVVDLAVGVRSQQAAGADGDRGAELAVDVLGVARRCGGGAGLDVLALREQLDHLEVIGQADLGGVLARQAGIGQVGRHVVEAHLLVGSGGRERAAEVHQVAAPLVLAGGAGLLAERVDEVGGQATEVRRGVQHRVVPARIADDARIHHRAAGRAEVGVEDRRREHVRVDQRVEQDGRHEVRRGVAAQLDGAGLVVLQADVGVAAEHRVAGEAAAVAAVGTEEAVQVEDGLGAAAQVFRALDAPVRRLHPARIGDPCALARTRALDRTDEHVGLAVQRHAGLGHGRAGKKGSRYRRQLQCRLVLHLHV